MDARVNRGWIGNVKGKTNLISVKLFAHLQELCEKVFWQVRVKLQIRVRQHKLFW